MRSMVSYPKAAMERAMKVQEVILRAMAKRITWWQAAEIMGISDRHMRGWRERYEEFGYDGLFDRRRGKPSPQRVPMALVEQVLGLYREKYFDLNVRHFHEKLRAEHQIQRHRARHVRQDKDTGGNLNPADVLHKIIQQTGEIAANARTLGDVRAALQALQQQASAMESLIRVREDEQAEAAAKVE